MIKTWTWLKKGNFMRKTISLLIVVQNNAIRTNYVKANIDKLDSVVVFGDRDKTIDYISQFCKLAHREYRTRHDTVGRLIHWE